MGPLRRLCCLLLALPTLHVCSSQCHFRNGVRWRLHSQSCAAGPRPATMGRHLLGWASGTPCASVLREFALPDSFHLSTGRALALFGRLRSSSCGSVCSLAEHLSYPGPLPLVSLSSPTPRCRESSRFWCRATLLLSGQPPMVAPSPSSVSTSTLELSVPTSWTAWSTIPLLILVWPCGGAWRGMVMSHVLVDEEPGTEVMCLHVHSVPAHPGTLFTGVLGSPFSMVCSSASCSRRSRRVG